MIDPCSYLLFVLAVSIFVCLIAAMTAATAKLIVEIMKGDFQ